MCVFDLVIKINFILIIYYYLLLNILLILKFTFIYNNVCYILIIFKSHYSFVSIILNIFMVFRRGICLHLWF